MKSRFHVLDGLPPYGPAAEPFSATGVGMHREGLVVELVDAGGLAWVGNFQRGGAGIDVVVACPGAPDVVVIAGGQAYVVSPDTRRCLRRFGGQIQGVLERPDRLVWSNGLWLEADDGARQIWRTRRLSWDGIAHLRIEGERAVGEAYDLMTNGWAPFSVGLADGDVIGGAYLDELPD